MRIKPLLFGTIAVAAAVSVFAICACSKENDSGVATPSNDHVGGFTFFDLTSESRLSSSVRKNLEKKLGSDAITRKSPIDLRIAPESVFEKHFPEVHSLNRRLNDPPNERVEHDVTKLMYRYPEQEQLPFSFVELVFSNHSGMPLVFHTRTNREGEALLETLVDKHGEGQVVSWNGEREKVYSWRRSGELMLFTLVRDRFGNPEYHLQILFPENIEELLRIEEEQREIRERKKKEAVRSVF